MGGLEVQRLGSAVRVLASAVSALLSVAGARRLQEFPVWSAAECLGVAGPCDYGAPYRTFDGSCSSLGDASWATAGYPFVRTGPPTYRDYIGKPRLTTDGRPLPDARQISATLFRDRWTPPDGELSHLVTAWGQLVAHDVTLKRFAPNRTSPCCTKEFRLPEGGSPEGCLEVKVAKDDYFYSKYNVRCLEFHRAAALEGGSCSKYPREQVNDVSQVDYERMDRFPVELHRVIDASMIYGSDLNTSNALRSFLGGKLKTSSSESKWGAFLSNDSAPIIPCQNPPTEHKCNHAGDIRVNQNLGSVALTTALLRLHNIICDRMAEMNPHWDDELIYQEVRRIVWAFVQHVTFKHYLPAVLGWEFVSRKGLSGGDGDGDCVSHHDPATDPGVYHEFAAAAFRYFHTMVSRDFNLVDSRFRDVGHLRIDDFFQRPSFLEYQHSLADLLRGLAVQPSQRADHIFTTGLTNHLFNRTVGADLEVLDIMSGRDMGLPRYVDMRLLCDGKQVLGFNDLLDVMSAESVWQLKRLYTSVEDVELFVGGAMENILAGAAVGPTFQCIIGEQFYHWMRGDRFYYENCGFPWSFTVDQIRAIRQTSLSWMYCVVADDMNYIQWATFYLPSSNNPIVSCEDIPPLDLGPWLDRNYDWE